MKSGGQKLYDQVTYSLASPETLDRKFGDSDSIRNKFPKFVVSLDEFGMSRNGIMLAPGGNAHLAYFT